MLVLLVALVETQPVCSCVDTDLQLDTAEEQIFETDLDKMELREMEIVIS